MSLLSSEQIAAAQKANLDTCFGLTSKVVEGIEKLVELNQQAIRSTLSESKENALRSLSSKEPGDWLTLQAALSAAIPERVQSYSRQVFDIASSVQADFVRLAQAQCEAYNKRVQTLVDDLAKSSPAGSEAAIAAWKSAVTATNMMVETAQKTYRQATQAAENNFAAVTVAASQTARRTSEQASATARP